MENSSENIISPISNYYRGKIILLTGVTGFLGECFVVKLLRIGVKAVYVLIRSRRNMTPQQRYEKLLKSPIFEPLLTERPNFADDIIPIAGSLDELELNISKEDQATLFEKIEIIIHSAADIRFDIPIAVAAIRNIRGTRELLKLAQKMKSFENFIHISTAYAFCMRDVIGEEFYKPPFDPDMIIKMVENIPTESELNVLTAFRDKIIYPWPNTYTFSKAITEDMVRKYGKYFKITIVKPSIVTAAFREPIEGWVSNFSGANGVFAGIVGGVLRCLKLNENAPIDMVYGDYVINGALAAGVDVSSGGSDNPPIYNIISSNDYIKTFDVMVKEILPQRNNAVPLRALWFPTFNFCHNNTSFFIYNMALHVIPAAFFDIALRAMGKKPQILKLYRQIHSFGDVINFFISSTFKFDNRNMKRVWNEYEILSNIIRKLNLKLINNFSMTLEDKKTFPCDFSDVYWPDYRDVYVFKGITATLLKDRSDKKTLKRNATKMKFIHYSFITFSVLCVALLFYMIFKKTFVIENL